jgi:hypothetical protein
MKATTGSSPTTVIIRYYRTFCSTGFLLFIPVPELIMLLLLIYLFYILFGCCMIDRNGSEAKNALKEHLWQMQQKFSGSDNIDPDRERAELDRLQNRMKVWNPGDTISRDPSLRYLFVRNYNLATEWPLTHETSDRTGWAKLHAVMKDFYDSYFANMIYNGHQKSLHARGRSLFSRLVPVRHHHAQQF